MEPKLQKILVADDDPINITIIIEALGADAYEFFIAKDGSQALEVIKNQSPDLVLLDILMPKFSGLEVCRQLKKLPEFEYTPVIFISSLADIRHIEEGFKIGGVDFVSKPFLAAELRQRVHTHLGTLHQSRQLARESEYRKELLHMLFHDIRNPIGKIQNCLDILDVAPAMLPDLATMMRSSTKQSLELLEVIGEMLASESGKRSLHCKNENLRDLIDQSIFILSDRIDLKQIKLSVDIPEQLTVYVEAVTFVNSVLNNLLTNAIKFSDTGSKITFRAQQNHDQTCTLTIKDTGIGIPSAMIKNLFDVTKSRSRSGTRGEQGTGFGMPLVKNFIDRYEGSIEITSTEASADKSDHGTEIKLTLRSMTAHEKKCS